MTIRSSWSRLGRRFLYNGGSGLGSPYLLGSGGLDNAGQTGRHTQRSINTYSAFHLWVLLFNDSIFGYHGAGGSGLGSSPSRGIYVTIVRPSANVILFPHPKLLPALEAHPSTGPPAPL